ncbi:MAG: hypothetical protein KGH52_04355 [Candidatus Micrarchaeota archaeon]|nr:hypothetical protein [Candidatus Micrarchaeota archaeon]
MRINIPFLKKVPLEITQVNIAYNSAMHSFNGIKAKKSFTYKLPFSNTEMVPMRILKVEVDKPFAMKKISHNIPLDVESGQRVVLELRIEFDGKFAYSGPLGIKLSALPISSRLAKK